MTLRYNPRPYEMLSSTEQSVVDKAFNAAVDVLKEGGMKTFNDDRAENLVDEIVRFTEGKH